MNEPTQNQEPSTEAPRGLDKPRNVKLIIIAVFLVCAGLFAADAAYHKHTHYDFEGWFGFFGWYGFIGCVGLVLAAKVMRRVLKRDEDYYDR